MGDTGDDGGPGRSPSLETEERNSEFKHIITSQADLEGGELSRLPPSFIEAGCSVSCPPRKLLSSSQHEEAPNFDSRDQYDRTRNPSETTVSFQRKRRRTGRIQRERTTS